MVNYDIKFLHLLISSRTIFFLLNGRGTEELTPRSKELLLCTPLSLFSLLISGVTRVISRNFLVG